MTGRLIFAAAMLGIVWFSGLSPALGACGDPPKPFVDWIQCDKKGADLQGANLMAADLTGANLEGADLRGAKLEAADLGGATLKDADLRGNLRAANLQGANLQGANLKGANLEEANIAEATLDGATWIDGSVCGPRSKGRCTKQ